MFWSVKYKRNQNLNLLDFFPSLHVPIVRLHRYHNRRSNHISSFGNWSKIKNKMSCYIHNWLKNWTYTRPYTSDPGNDRIVYHFRTSLFRPWDTFADREKTRIPNIEKLQKIRAYILTIHRRDTYIQLFF